jgi:hypothetical protein
MLHSSPPAQPALPATGQLAQPGSVGFCCCGNSRAPARWPAVAVPFGLSGPGGGGGRPAWRLRHQVLMVRWLRRIQPEHHSTSSPPQTRARTSWASGPMGLVPQLAQGLGPGTKHVPALAAGGRSACSFRTCCDPTEQPPTALARSSRLERALQGPGDLNLSPSRMGRLTPGLAWTCDLNRAAATCSTEQPIRHRLPM